MNITIKITYQSGTVMDLSIPIQEPIAPSSPKEQPSAVVYHETPVKGVEAPIAAPQQASPIDDDDWVAETNLLRTDLLPSGKRYKSVAEMVAATLPDLAHEFIREKGSVGEDGVGDGRIGGVGERKEEVGEGEGRGEKPERFQPEKYNCDDMETSLDGFQFPCDGGYLYTPPMPLVRDFVLAFGEEHVRVEFLKSRAWLTANPAKRKTQRGMGRYLTTWLCHKSGMKRTPIKEILKTKSLLSDGIETQTGW